MTTSGNLHKPCRIVFFGTPEFAVHCLDALVQNHYEVVGVVTAPDRKAGRGKKITPSAVKNFAEKKGLKVLQPENLKDTGFIDQLKALKADLMIVVAFRMLPKQVWELPPLGTFNLHASLLPQYRGAAPINWAIINGEKISGVTTFLIDEKIDTGALLLQEKIPLSPEETAGSLHDKMAQIGSQVMLQTIDGLVNQTLKAQVQSTDMVLKPAPKLTKENTKICWDAALEAIASQIKGLDPYPGAWTNFQNGSELAVVKIFEVAIVKEKNTNPPGKIIIVEKQIRVAHPEGWLVCKTLQLPNKRRLAASALLNGYQFGPNACFLN